MSNETFATHFSKHAEKLDLFFHRKLKEARLTQNIEDVKLELTQRTAVAVLEKLQQDRYGDYHLGALIWIKAADTWKRYVRAPRGKGPKILPTEPSIELAAADHFIEVYEMADWLHSLRTNLGDKQWKMLMMHLEGFGYKDIAQTCDMKENAVRVTIHRLKIRLQRPL